MSECPFIQEGFLRPPSAIRAALREDFMPHVYGESFRREVQARFPDAKPATIDALELQRHLTPIISDLLETINLADPQAFKADNCPDASSLFDVRSGTQAGLLDLGQAIYNVRYPEDSLEREYHDQVAARYLSAKRRGNITALNRLEDGIGTAVHAPFAFFEALQHHSGLPEAAETAKKSWRVVQGIAQLDLGSYQFLTEEWFVPIDEGRGDIHSFRFNQYSKWLKLFTYDAEQKRYSLDIAPKALGRHAIGLSAKDKQDWESIKTTGAERLRCPITRLPDELTQGYVNFLVDVTVASGVWPAPDATTV